MRYIFNFPDIGEGLEEGTIAEWYVQKGQQIESGDPLVNMETDKVATDIPSPKAGTIVAIYGKVGETIKVGDSLVEIEIEGVSGKKAVEEARKEPEIEEEGAGVVGTFEVAGNKAFLPPSEEGIEVKVDEDKPQKKSLATPVARAYAKDFKVDINKVKGTGPAGRVTKSDIQENLEKVKLVTAAELMHSKDAEPLIEYEPLSQLRKTIAKNMIQSKHNAAHMSVFEEVEVSELIRLREKYKTNFSEDGVSLSYLPFILKALTKSLKKFRVLNSELDLENNRMIFKKYYNIGIAVDTEAGLVVPVIRNVDKLSIFELAQKLNEISEKARDRKLTLDDMKNGTFTITSYGSIAGLFAVPVINYPQAGILGIGRIHKKPIVKNDNIEIGNILPLSLSVDHRIVDGGEVARFISQVISYLEDPASMIME
ncbi:dihydrolipoamide acetyltransferase family protein [Bacteroidota bacterium]